MDNNDVELNALLGIDSEEITTSGASATNSTEDLSSVAASDATKEVESRRENDRIRLLVEENKKLKESQNWLEGIEDEGTRNLLKKTIEEAESRIESKYKPLMSNYREERFDKEFAQYAEKLSNLIPHKDELKKEFLRNPNSELKGMVGNLTMELLISKLTPLESKGTQAPRDEVVGNLSSASKEDLYAMLLSKRV